jgi:hypothetical protein
VSNLLCSGVADGVGREVDDCKAALPGLTGGAAFLHLMTDLKIGIVHFV